MELANIGPYRVLKKLGAGGMGEVYLAEDPRLERKVAIKRVSQSRLQTPEAREQLRQEARAAARLTHPNIAIIYDVVECDDQPFIVMEYVKGQTLEELLFRGALTLAEVLDIGAQIVDALAEAHSLGIVHRDLKPSNILLTDSGQVKILDFGLARIEHSRESQNTTAGRIVGTLAYMAPEQMLGYRADYRSDIFAVGVVLFELSTGRRPFEERERNSPAFDNLRSIAPSASALNPSLPSGFSEAIARAMSWEPSDRHQSARELGQALRAVRKSLSNASTLARSDPPHVRNIPSSPWARGKHARNLLATSVLIAMAVMVWMITSERGWDPASPPVVAVVPFENVSGDEAIDHVGVGIAHTLITKLSAIPTVTTISSDAVAEYGANSRGPRELARDLDASFIVNGFVQRERDVLRITVNVVRADATVAWGSEFEGGVSELFELQRRIAAGVSNALHLNLTRQQKQELDEPLTADVNAYAEYSQGRYFLERSRGPEDLARGVRLLESAVAKDPSFAQAHAALGEAYWEHFARTTERVWTEKARRAAERARELAPDHPAVHYVLAIIYNGTGQESRALDELRRALALQPNYDDAYRLLGEIYSARGDSAAATRELRHAIAIRPNFWGHYYSLGLAHYRTGQWSQATELFQRVTELQPDLATGFQSLGATFHMMGDLENAVANYEKSIELSPNAPSLNNLGTVYYRQRRYADAARSYERARQLQPNRAVTHRNLGDTYRRLGEAEKASAAYRRAAELHRNILDINANDARARALLALMEAKLQRHEEASRLIERAIELAPSDPQVLYHNAVIHVLAGRAGEAVASLHLAIEHGYGISELREDDDLDALRELPTFQTLLANGDEE